MRVSNFLALALLLALFGCGKKATAPMAPPNLPSENATAPNAATAPSDARAVLTASPPTQMASSGQVTANLQPVIISESAEMTVVLDQLTQALRKYSVENRKIPASFGEVVGAGYVQGMPAPPVGKQFVIDRKLVRVVLGRP